MSAPCAATPSTPSGKRWSAAAASPCPPCEAEEADGEHTIRAEITEDEYYVTVDHPMTREHHISFLAAVSDQTVQFVKLYPEGSAEARFKIDRVRKLCAYCNRHGLFQVKPVLPGGRFF